MKISTLGLDNYYQRLPILLLLLLASAALSGQAWRSDLYPENWRAPGEEVSFYTDKIIQDFSYAGYRRGEEAIPEVAGPVFNVIDYGADQTGVADSTVAIQTAIHAAAAAGGGVVHLPAGEYRVAPRETDNFALRIQTSNIILRGAGAGQTFLLNTSYQMRSRNVILVAPASVSTGAGVAITADLMGPTKRIPVANAGAFTPGDIVLLQWNFTTAWISEHGQLNWWSESAGPADAQYRREVTAVSVQDGWIEVDIPTRYAMLTRDSARVHRIAGKLVGVAVEDLSIGNVQHPGTQWAENDYTIADRSAYQVHGSWLISVRNVYDGWISGVHSYRPAGNTTTAHMLSNGMSMINTFRFTVRNCEMRRAQYGGGGGNGYMYRIQQSNECLIKDSLADFSRHGFVVSHAGTSGNVFLRVEDRETARATGATTNGTGYSTSGSGSDHHMHFSHSNLIDQSLVHNSFFTAHHRGTSGTIGHALTSAHTVFWNTSGSGTRGGAIVRSEQARYGYIIGTSGQRRDASANVGGNTAPVDHVEGVGIGDRLEPASLYVDQLSQRLVPRLRLFGESAQFPNNTFVVQASDPSEDPSTPAPSELAWTLVSSPAGARIVSLPVPEGRAFTVSHPGEYTIEAAVPFASPVTPGQITIVVRSAETTTGGSIDIQAEADAHVQGGAANESLNFGSAAELLLRNDGTFSEQREAFIRFDLSGISGDRIHSATLNMNSTSTLAGAIASTGIVLVPVAGWDELGLNWTSRPTLQVTHIGDWPLPIRSAIQLDTTNPLISLLRSRTAVTFRNQIFSQPGPTTYRLASREHPLVQLRPLLRIQFKPLPLEAWLAENSSLPPEQRGPMDDPDGDGLSNLFEAWLGTDPSQADGSRQLFLLIHDGRLEIHFAINALPPAGLNYLLEYSDSLHADDWHLTPHAIWEQSGPEADGRIPMRIRMPEGPEWQNRFYRILLLQMD